MSVCDGFFSIYAESHCSSYNISQSTMAQLVERKTGDLRIASSRVTVLFPQARLSTGSTQEMSHVSKSMAERVFQATCFKVIAGGKRSHVQNLYPLHMSPIPGLIMNIFHQHIHPN